MWRWLTVRRSATALVMIRKKVIIVVGVVVELMIDAVRDQIRCFMFLLSNHNWGFYPNE